MPPPLKPAASYDRPQSREDFRIAIVCALRLEYDAVSLLFDHFWDSVGEPYTRAPRDKNIYTAGRVGLHNVVLVLLSGMGEIEAAVSASSLASSYPNITLLLLVGICGGVPDLESGDEILLGDVVIGKTIFQYDFGREYPIAFVPKDTAEDKFGRPSKDVRNFIARCETEHEKELLRTDAAKHLGDIQRTANFKERAHNYLRPGPAQDKLFPATYPHKH